VVEAVNLAYEVLDKTGNKIMGPKSLYDLFGFPTGSNLTDPIVRFDPGSGRWFILVTTWVDNCSAGTIALAVSDTGDPTGQFRVFNLTVANLPDFPKIGISDDKVVVSADAWNPCSTFQGTEFTVFNKAGLIGASVAFNDNYLPTRTGSAIAPAQSLSSSSKLYMAAVSTAANLDVWSLNGIPGSGSGTSFPPVSNVTLKNSLSPPPPAVQQGANLLVTTKIDNRLLDAYFSNGALWVSANDGCTPTGDNTQRSCLRFVQIDTANMTVNQDFDFGTVGSYYYYPAIRPASNGDLIAVFSGSSSSQYPSLYAGASLSPNFGGLQQLTLLHSGDGTYTQKDSSFQYVNRWGDYSGAGVDPVDASVWVAGEYGKNDAFGASMWGTWISQISRPSRRAKFAYVADECSNGIWAFTIDAQTGALAQVAGSPFPGDLAPSSVTVSPSGKFVYAANPVGPGDVSGYAIDAATGALSPVPGSPFSAGFRTSSMAVDPFGRFAYVTIIPFAGSGSVMAYTVNTGTGALTPVSGPPVAAGGSPVSVTIDPTGRFAYVANMSSDNISAYTINAVTGALTPIHGSPFPAGTQPVSVAVDPTDHFAYAANANTLNQGTVSAYLIDSTTGALTPVSGSPFDAGNTPSAVVVHPSGRFVYVTNRLGGNTISGYSIDAATGRLAPLLGSPFPVDAANSFSIAVDPSGQFAYTANASSPFAVSAFRIDASTGALTRVPGSPFPGGLCDTSVVTTSGPGNQ